MSLAESQSTLYHEWIALKALNDIPARDKYGRLRAGNGYFDRTGKLWEPDEIEYMVSWYHITGPTEMGYALDRTPQSVNQKAYYLGLTEGVQK